MEPSTITTNIIRFQEDNILLRKKYDKEYFIHPLLEDNAMIEKTILSMLYRKHLSNTTLILQKTFEELLGIPIKILPLGKNTSQRFLYFKNLIENSPKYRENRDKFLQEVRLISDYKKKLNLENQYDSIPHISLYY